MRAMTRDCRVAGVVDGDTVNLACAGEADAQGADRRLRRAGALLAAVRGGAGAAARAKQVLATWVWHATSTEVAFLGRDRYGRTLVDMRLSGQRVAQGMVASGNGRRYVGRLRGGWC